MVWCNSHEQKAVGAVSCLRVLRKILKSGARGGASSDKKLLWLVSYSALFRCLLDCCGLFEVVVVEHSKSSAKHHVSLFTRVDVVFEQVSVGRRCHTLCPPRTLDRVEAEVTLDKFQRGRVQGAFRKASALDSLHLFRPSFTLARRCGNGEKVILASSQHCWLSHCQSHFLESGNT